MKKILRVFSIIFLAMNSILFWFLGSNAIYNTDLLMDKTGRSIEELAIYISLLIAIGSCSAVATYFITKDLLSKKKKITE